MDADQQADGLDGQPVQPQRLHQRLHRLEHLGPEVRGLRADESLTGGEFEHAPVLVAWGLIRGCDGSGSPLWHRQGCRCGTRF